MVSWDIKIKLKDTLSPTITDIIKLSKEQGFSNIEGVTYLKSKGEYTYYELLVNNRTFNKESNMMVVK